MPKKQISNTSFDLIYIFGASIVTGLIQSVIEELVRVAGFDLGSISTKMNAGVGLLIWLISIWLGVMAVSWYINKNFTLEDKGKALRSALTFFAAFAGVSLIALLVIGISTSYLVVILIQAFIAGVVLYFFGKRYIKESEVEGH